MLPHQKYPSVYRGYPQDGLNHPQPPQTTIPQSPFDVAYGSSLLPRQLLVSSPFVQVPSPLPSPIHTNPHQYYQRSSSYSNIAPNGYFPVAGPPPKLHLPPRRHSNYRDMTPSRRRQKVNGSTAENVVTRDINNVASSETSSLDDQSSVLEFNHRPPANVESSDNLKSSSSTSLNQLYNSTNSSSVSNISIHQSNLQISKIPTRSIMLTDINPDLTISTLLDFINFGPLESVRLVENYPSSGINSIVLAFLKIDTCLNFFNSLLTYLSKFQKLIHSPDLSINFIHSKKILPFISYAISNDGATRNVYIGNLNGLPHPVDEAFIRNEFLKFGIIDKLDLVSKPVKKLDEDGGETEEIEKFAFVHFTNIASAIKTVEQLSLNPFWQDTKIFYGTDRCSIQNDSLIRSIIDEDDEEDEEVNDNDDLVEYFNNEENTMINYDERTPTAIQYLYSDQGTNNYPTGLSSYNGYRSTPQLNALDVEEALHQKHNAAIALASSLGGGRENSANRTICLSNLDHISKVEDICNVVRGGIIQNIKHLPERRICFITFVEHVAAAQFFANSQLSPLTLHGRKLRVGWGSHAGPLPTQIALAVTVGASRNVYIGKEDESDDVLPEGTRILPVESELRKDFENFGELEQINFFRNEHCVFLNFCNISNAIKVVNDANGTLSDEFHEYFQNKYKGLKISYGKDRCGNPPKVKKRKRIRKKTNRRENDTDENDVEENGESNEKLNGEHEVEEVPVELFASMGISQKGSELPPPQTPIKQQLVDPAIDAFGISSNQANGDATSNISTVEEEENELENDDSITDLEIITNGPTTTASTSTTSSTTTNNTTNTNNNSKSLPKHKKEAKSYTPSMGSESSKVYYPRQASNHQRRQHSVYGSKASSRVSSQVSLNSYYDQPYQPPFAPPSISRGGSRTNLSSYYPPQQHPHIQYSTQVAPGGYSYNTTSGLQVMAQYLQQSQHANLLYAANILNEVDSNPSIGNEYNMGYEYQRRSSGKKDQRRRREQ